MDLLSLNYVLAVGTILMQLGTIMVVAMYSLRATVPFCGWCIARLRDWALLKACVLALVASALTLYYSDVLGIIPCGLCWLERVFLYPQVILLGIAAWRKDSSIALYSMALSALGAVVALYHHFIQMGGSEFVPCPASGTGDCAKRIIFEFGYITFPLMAFSLFALLFVTMWVLRKIDTN